jgi:hypothetical protein
MRVTGRGVHPGVAGGFWCAAIEIAVAAVRYPIPFAAQRDRLELKSKNASGERLKEG